MTRHNKSFVYWTFLLVASLLVVVPLSWWDLPTERTWLLFVAREGDGTESLNTPLDSPGNYSVDKLLSRILKLSLARACVWEWEMGEGASSITGSEHSFFSVIPTVTHTHLLFFVLSSTTFLGNTLGMQIICGSLVSSSQNTPRWVVAHLFRHAQRECKTRLATASSQGLCKINIQKYGFISISSLPLSTRDSSEPGTWQKVKLIIKKQQGKKNVSSSASSSRHRTLISTINESFYPLSTSQPSG